MPNDLTVRRPHLLLLPIPRPRPFPVALPRLLLLRLLLTLTARTLQRARVQPISFAAGP